MPHRRAVSLLLILSFTAFPLLAQTSSSDKDIDARIRKGSWILLYLWGVHPPMKLIVREGVTNWGSLM